MIDSHCHIQYYDNYKEIVKNTQLTAMLCLFDIDELEHKQEQWNYLCKNVYTCLGIHPNKVNTISLKSLDKHIDQFHENIIAIGETGIDLHYSTHDTLDKQIEYLQHHIKLCKKYNKTLVLHCRSCTIDLILEQINNSGVRVVLHSFNYTWSDAKKALDYGCWISLSGMLTFKSCYYLQEVALKTPLNKLLLETDSPYLTPCPLRGKPNYPDYVKYNYEMVSKIRNIPLDSLVSQINLSFYNAFNIKSI